MGQMDYIVEVNTEVNYGRTEPVLGGIPNLHQLKQLQSTVYVDTIQSESRMPISCPDALMLHVSPYIQIPYQEKDQEAEP